MSLGRKAVNVKAQVEDLLIRQGVGRRRAATEQIGARDGYVAECPGGGTAIVRCGPTAVADFPALAGSHRCVITDTLAMCADVLDEAGYCVRRARDGHGAYLCVSIRAWVMPHALGDVRRGALLRPTLVEVGEKAAYPTSDAPL